MSTSTVPVPAANNNASVSLDSNLKSNVRRRTVVLIDRNPNTDTIHEGGTDGVSNDREVANGKDLSHTIRGESVVGHSGDLPQSKKVLITSTTPTPRRKRPISKSEKPKWQTALSVLTKNILLMIILFWLGQMVWKWIDGIQDHTNSPFAALDYEGRVSEVEASLKRMAKMFQVQLEVLDKKIGSEIGSSTRELMNKFAEKEALLDKELKSLSSRADILDKSLGELKDKNTLSVEEFERFWNELKNNRIVDRSDDHLNLDQIRAFARNIVEKEIEKHAADGIGRVDYALASGGGKVVQHSQPYSSGKVDSWSSAFKSHHRVHANAHKMLEPSFGEPGQCFALAGSQVSVHIKLRTAIIPSSVTIEHASESVAYDRSSAPKEGRVFGWLEESASDSSRESTRFLVATFLYDLEKSNIQTFDVVPGIAGPINMVHLVVDSNHGSSSFTCIYRFRVHGYEPSSPAAMDMVHG